MGTIKSFPDSVQLLKLDPRWREAPVLFKNVGNGHRAAREQEMGADRDG